MERWSLVNVETCLEVQSKFESFPQYISSARIVSPRDLNCFKISNTTTFGLAAIRVRDGDCIWQFQETSLVSSSDRVKIGIVAVKSWEGPSSSQSTERPNAIVYPLQRYLAPLQKPGLKNHCSNSI
jgi:hypothetical protein